MVNVPPDTCTISISIDGAVPDCDTPTVCDDTPEPLTVRFTFRTAELVLAAAVTVTVPSPEPDCGATVNHDAPLKLTDQLMLELTVKVLGESVAAKLNVFGNTLKEGGAIPDCDTLMFCVGTPAPLTDRVAVRCDEPVFSAAVTVTVPSFEPDS